MSTQRRRALPPQMLDGGRVVCFAHLDERVRPTGNTVHTIAGEAAPPFRSLAVIEEAAGGPYYLLYCDQNWNSLTDTWHETLDEAKAQAEFEFQGISRAWRTRLSEA